MIKILFSGGAIASMIYGGAAILLPAAAVIVKSRRFYLFTTLSWIFCALSILCELYLQNTFVQRGDWTALMDTAESMFFGSAGLVLGVIIFHAAARMIMKQRDRKFNAG